MKIGANSTCPCGSHQKYKKCCKVFHNGALPKNALLLMKSRYSAFAVNDAAYIIKTTHEENPDYTQDKIAWKASILEFSQNSRFEKLEIVEFIDGETEAFVTFKATIFQNNQDVSFCEKSRFLKQNQQWLYHSGAFLS